jgi:hypothetical protein
MNRAKVGTSRFIKTGVNPYFEFVSSTDLPNGIGLKHSNSGTRMNIEFHECLNLYTNQL